MHVQAWYIYLLVYLIILFIDPNFTIHSYDVHRWSTRFFICGPTWHVCLLSGIAHFLLTTSNKRLVTSSLSTWLISSHCNSAFCVIIKLPVQNLLFYNWCLNNQSTARQYVNNRAGSLWLFCTSLYFSRRHSSGQVLPIIPCEVCDFSVLSEWMPCRTATL